MIHIGQNTWLTRWSYNVGDTTNKLLYSSVTWPNLSSNLQASGLKTTVSTELNARKLHVVFTGKAVGHKMLTSMIKQLLMHISMVCPRMGGPGNPRELDFVKRTWVGILTSTTVPRVGNLTRPPSWKVERTWEWVSGPPCWKIPRRHLSEFPASEDGWTKY